MSLPAAPLALSDEDRAELGRLLASGPQRVAERARVVLACAEPSADGNSGVAAGLGLTPDTVRRWRERFLASGVAGLADGARPGQPKAGLVLAGAEREQLTRWARLLPSRLPAQSGREHTLVPMTRRSSRPGDMTRRRTIRTTDQAPPINDRAYTGPTTRS